MKINGKKLTIRHFLNTRIDSPSPSHLYKSKESLPKRHPVYTVVTYNRKSNQFAFTWDKNADASIGFTKEEFDNIFIRKQIPHFNVQITDIERLIKSSVEYEIIKLGDKFSLKGFSKRIEYYQTELMYLITERIESDIYQVLEDHITVTEFKRLRLCRGNSFQELIERIIDNNSGYEDFLNEALVDKIVAGNQYFQYANLHSTIATDDGNHHELVNFLIDWLNGSANEQIINFMKNKAKGQYETLNMVETISSPYNELSYKYVEERYPFVYSKIDDYMKALHDIFSCCITGTFVGEFGRYTRFARIDSIFEE